MVKTPRSPNQPTAVDDLLSDPGHSLGSLCRHARRLAQLEATLCGCVDPETAANLKVANVRQDRLILLAPTAAWATRLRMLAPQIVRFLAGSGYDAIRHIDIRIAPGERVEPVVHAPRKLSAEAEQALQQIRRLTARTD